ncbi:MAG: arginine--tRNA ligase, partial [Eubacteriales bacterium]|nr:arginine--tRNA ligase [Eubacteriales bacterium]
MIDYKIKVAELFSDLVDDVTLEDIYGMVEIPPNSQLGDFAVPCFRFAKAMRKSPNMIAETIASQIQADENFDKVVNEGPYVNFFVSKASFAKDILTEIDSKKEKYGSKDIGQGRSVIVEFSSPNIAKPFHIGHIRTTIIGNVLYNIYKFLGFNAIAINHLGDYGTQFGMLISAYKKWGEKEVIEKNPIPELLKLYIRFNEETEKTPELIDEARHWFRELENGNEEAI